MDGIRKGLITVSENTMYKVNKVLGIRKTKDKSKKKKRHKKGIRASRPNQIWHADITTLKSKDGNRHYIYLVIDNFSRKILSYSIQDRVSGLITKSTIEEAYNNAHKLGKDLNVDLIVDGGPENNNIYVNGFISQSNINMRKLVALKDINYSNSMIERVNHTLKYRYIFPHEPKNRIHLERILRFFINDYNIVKPHGALAGLTPDEAWNGFEVDKQYRTKLLQDARLERLRHNRENKCDLCH